MYGTAFFHAGMITFGLHDFTPGKEKTVATLDRALQFATRLLKNQQHWDS